VLELTLILYSDSIVTKQVRYFCAVFLKYRYRTLHWCELLLRAGSRHSSCVAPSDQTPTVRDDASIELRRTQWVIQADRIASF